MILSREIPERNIVRSYLLFLLKERKRERIIFSNVYLKWILAVKQLCYTVKVIACYVTKKTFARR